MEEIEIVIKSLPMKTREVVQGETDSQRIRAEKTKWQQSEKGKDEQTADNTCCRGGVEGALIPRSWDRRLLQTPQKPV